MRALIALALIAIGSCASPLCGCTPERSMAVIDGTLRDGTATGLGGYRIRSELAIESAGGCGAFSEVLSRRVTQPDGSFMLDVDHFGISLCVRFYAQDTTSAAAEHAFADTVRVQPRRYPFDTVAVNLVLTP